MNLCNIGISFASRCSLGNCRVAAAANLLPSSAKGQRSQSRQVIRPTFLQEQKLGSRDRRLLVQVRQSTATIKKRYTHLGIGGCGSSATLESPCEIKALINERLAVTRNFRAADGASTQNFDRGGAPAIPASAPGGGIAGAKL